MTRGVTRRAFAIGAGAFAVGGCRSLFTGAAGDFDDRLAVFFSDAHVSGTDPAYAYTSDRLRAFVAHVLAMSPLPRHVFFLGDLARFHGRREDYAAAVPLLKPLYDAGVKLVMGVGNHDRHDVFFEHFPDVASASPVPGSAVSVAHLPDFDVLVLDSLDDRAEGGTGGGRLGDAEQAWLKEALPQLKRPTIVCAHHDLDELRLDGGLLGIHLANAPMVRGYVYGHVHKWSAGWYHRHRWTAADHVYKKAALPSVGYWGDIGWAELRSTPSAAALSLVQTDFFFPVPVGFGDGGLTRRPPEWDDMIAANRGAKCVFRL